MANELHALWGQKLKAARRSAGLSLTQISQLTGLHKSHYCRIEAGDTAPSDDVRIAIASAVGARVEEIWAYPDPANSEARVTGQ